MTHEEAIEAIKKLAYFIDPNMEVTVVDDSGGNTLDIYAGPRTLCTSYYHPYTIIRDALKKGGVEYKDAAERRITVDLSQGGIVHALSPQGLVFAHAAASKSAEDFRAAHDGKPTSEQVQKFLRVLAEKLGQNIVIQGERTAGRGIGS